MPETYYSRKTPDYSGLVVHFTKDRSIVRHDLIDEDHPLFPYKISSAKDKLINILQSKTIIASYMPHLPHTTAAVCFTECVWKGLVEQTHQYSRYGVVFSKKLIFESGGGPALYVRGDSMNSIGGNVPSILEPFIAPFDPDAVMTPGVPLDWVHEREWRLPSTLTFEYSDIECVIVGSIQDATQIVHQIGAQNIPEEKFITMDVYITIEETWS